MKVPWPGGGLLFSIQRIFFQAASRYSFTGRGRRYWITHPSGVKKPL